MQSRLGYIILSGLCREVDWGGTSQRCAAQRAIIHYFSIHVLFVFRWLGWPLLAFQMLLPYHKIEKFLVREWVAKSDIFLLHNYTIVYIVKFTELNYLPVVSVHRRLTYSYFPCRQSPVTSSRRMHVHVCSPTQWFSAAYSMLIFPFFSFFCAIWKTCILQFNIHT